MRLAISRLGRGRHLKGCEVADEAQLRHRHRVSLVLCDQAVSNPFDVWHNSLATRNVLTHQVIRMNRAQNHEQGIDLSSLATSYTLLFCMQRKNHVPIRSYYQAKSVAEAGV